LIGDPGLTTGTEVNMKALRKHARQLLDRVRLTTPQPAEPEPVYGERRPYKSFFDALTPEQQRKALGYTGPENHGDPAFKIRKAHA
jgi:hypothetical protein